ncbi:MAG TPA: site-2 protease family protein [Vicinamibacteria bacterium]|nr:site-2 protease family protein [Vicinamibacteria bacterium]
MLELTPQHIAQGLTAYIVLLFSLSVHESAHAWMAHRLGDDTAKNEGRVTLNPIPHIDPIGTIVMPLLQFLFSGIPLLAWAKPTPYNPANFRRDVAMRKGHMLVAGAGPVSNLILAVVFTVALFLVVRTGVADSPTHPLLMLPWLGVQLNVILAVFNLFPIPPLDGSKVASYGLPGSIGERYDRVMEPYGFLILMVLLMSGVLGRVLMPIRAWLVDLLFGLVR